MKTDNSKQITDNSKSSKAKALEGKKSVKIKKDKLEKLKQENKELDNKYKKALADYQNLIKRTTKEKDEFVKYANEQLIYDMIPVYDNLKISLEHTNEEIEKSPWLQGVKYVLKQFKDILSGVGVEEIKTVGEKFDHNTMEALEGEGDIVVKEMKPGYKLNGKVIISAKVAVGKKKD